MARGGHGEEQSIWTRAKAGGLEEHEHRQGESRETWASGPGSAAV